MIAIHNSPSGFHTRWENYCLQNNITYKTVNCYDSDIVSQLADCKALMWHHHQGNPCDLNIAKPILFALEHAGIKVFPDFHTNWHFDDKVGQKYLLEAINAPLVPTYVFVDKQKAIDWTKSTDFPKVFKLRGGAGSQNVKLAHTETEARKLIHQAFGRGFSNYDKWGSIRERYRKWRLGKTTTFGLLKGFIRLGISPPFAKVMGRESGYVYFQDFIPGNDHDIRVVVIGDKAFAIKRMVRKNDFRASGGGNIMYNKELFDISTLKLSFELSEKLKTQCVAFDFVFEEGTPLLVEISYGFSPAGYEACPGYWDKSLAWHNGRFNPYGWMVDEIVKTQIG